MLNVSKHTSPMDPIKRDKRWKNHHFSILVGDTSSFVVSHVRKLLGTTLSSVHRLCNYVLCTSVDRRSPGNNHLGYIKPCKQWDKLPTSTGAGLFSFNRSIESKCHPVHPFGFEPANILGFSVLWPIDLWISWVQMFLENVIHPGLSMEKKRMLFSVANQTSEANACPIPCFKSMSP